jgi:SAM-dependent methyltransferase
MQRLNLASGQRPFPTWTNVDIRKQFKDDGTPYQIEVEADVRKLDMFEDNSVDTIVAHHLVEHFHLNDQLDIAKEWHRVLKPGGKLAVFVPNIKALAEAWLGGRIDNFIFFVNMYGAYQGYYEDTHKWGFDENELRDRLSGWDGSNRNLEWANIQLLTPNMIARDDHYQGADVAFDWWILSMEFTK